MPTSHHTPTQQWCRIGNAYHTACMDLVGTRPGEWSSPWTSTEVSSLAGYILPTCCLPPPSFSCCPEHLPAATAPAVLSLHQPVLRSGWIDFAHTRLQIHFFCCGKSTQLHRIRPIKHEASWGSISSAWRVLHHAKRWLLQPYTSNLFHFSGPVSAVGYRSTWLFVLI